MRSDDLSAAEYELLALARCPDISRSRRAPGWDHLTLAYGVDCRPERKPAESGTLRLIVPYCVSQGYDRCERMGAPVVGPAMKYSSCGPPKVSIRFVVAIRPPEIPPGRARDQVSRKRRRLFRRARLTASPTCCRFRAARHSPQCRWIGDRRGTT